MSNGCVFVTISNSTAKKLSMALNPLDPLTAALEVIAQVMRDGAITHPNQEWIEQSIDEHLSHAEEHLRLLREGDQSEPHLAHAATRLLMALTRFS
jgi:hypothetical protein